MDVRGIAALSALSLAAGVAFLVLRLRMPLWTYHLATVAAIVAITASIGLNGDPASNNELFYLYGAGFSFYFFAWYEACGYTLLSLVLYGWAEARIGGGSIEPNALVIFAGCMVMLGAMLRVLGGRSRALAAELERQATTDELTGLMNRRGVQRLVDSEMERALRVGRPFSLLIGDLDRFKSVNDTLGHMGGDMALERVAVSLSREARAMDTVARIGGEEFAILMPETTAAEAEAAAGRFRSAVSSAFEDRPVALTLSIGIASYPSHGESWEQLLDAADTALYAAKDGGRDQVVAFGSAAAVTG